MTTTPTPPQPIEITPTNTRFLKEPDSDGHLRYMVDTGADRIVFSCLFSREQILDLLYQSAIESIIALLPHIEPHHIRSVVRGNLPGYDRWPDEPNFVAWAARKCQTAYYFALTCEHFLDGLEKIFYKAPHEQTAVDYLIAICE